MLGPRRPRALRASAHARRWRIRRLRCVLPILAFVGCIGGTSAGRYTMATDPGARYGFRYVRDRESGLWVHRECEVRVSAQRKLPDPISDAEGGDRLHSQRFDGNDLQGRSAFGVQVEHPKPGEPSDWEPMELFAFPPMATMVPDAWSEWTLAANQRAGAFGWWEEVHGSAPEPPVPIEFPFELRCRLLLKDHLYVD
jgi:hypothetical protein